MSVTMLLGILDLETGEVRMVSAGHEDPLLLTSDGAVTRVRLEGGPPFCITDYPYPLESLKLKSGDTLVLVTDGVTEAQNGQGKLFGSGRILADYERNAGSAAETCEAIRVQVRRFEAETEVTDDLTVLAIRYL
jgi:serine phosphatase RsbU (regulator of sigma subunit)